MRSSATRIIGGPRKTSVRCDPGGTPVAVAGRPVECVRDEWRVDEGWWSGHRLRRRYFDLVLADGRNVVVFHELGSGRWYGQRA
jgi:hypothetical protein